MKQIFKQHIYKLKTFTLAEVLITLGIIGIVAALTIPVIINKINFIAYKVQLKQEYSRALSAIRLMAEDNEREYTCYYDNSGIVKADNCPAFWNDFFKYRKLSHVCDAKDYTCRPNYVKNNNIISNNGGTAGNCTLFAHMAKGYVLENGVIYYPWIDPIWSGSGCFPAIFTVDVNGMKGPNKYGYDVFYVHFYKSGGRIYFSNKTCSSPVEKGGKTFDEMLK